MSENVLELRKFVAPEFVFGVGAWELAGRFARNFEAQRVLLVTDPGVLDAGWAGKVIANLHAADVETVVFSDVSPNPRAAQVMAGAAVYAQEGCDAIVAVGGGSPMDCAKGIGVVHTNGRHVLEFEGVDKVASPGPPLICIPTTAGTGAEVSQFAIINDTGRKVKIAIVSKTAVPDAALIDPEATGTMDGYLTACTGMDVLTHAVEAYVSNASSPTTDLLALNAITLVADNLAQAIASPHDMELRGRMALASLHAGLAFSNAILGAVHAMAHSLGGFLDLAHGECNAILLPYVLDFNFESCPDRCLRIGAAMGVPSERLRGDEGRGAVVDAVHELKKRVGIVNPLSSLGVREEDLAELSAKAVADPCMLTNPREVTASEVAAIFRAAM
ncbi:MAG: alcohol dehydrogenase-like regulatory protein ErcA [Desulfovibrionaceae bacterium]